MKDNKNIQATIENVEASFKNIFPNGFILVRVRAGLGEPYLCVDLGLIGDINDVSHCIRENDPLYTSLMGHNVSDVVPFQIETLQSGLSCNPEEGSHYAMSRVKTAYRKTTNDLAKAEKNLEKYFKKIAKIVKDNQDNIYGVENIDPKYFEINA